MKCVLFLLITCSLWSQVTSPTSNFPAAVATYADLLQDSNNATTQLTHSLTNADTTVVVRSTANFASNTRISVDNEVIAVCSKTSNTFTVCASGRGAEGSVASPHLNGAKVNKPGGGTSEFHNRLAAHIMSVEGVMGAGLSAYCNDTSVTPNTITCTTNYIFPTTYQKGQQVRVSIANTNTGATTININGIGSSNVTSNGSAALTGGELVASGLYLMHYTGTNFQLSGTVSGGGSGGQPSAYTTVSFSATPTFTCAANTASSFLITLTGNVTSSTLSCSGRPILTFKICQDGAGNHTFSPPSNVLSIGTINAAANTCSQQTFVYDGTNAQPLGAMLVTGVSGSALKLAGSSSGVVTVQPPAAAGSGIATLISGSNTVIPDTGVANDFLTGIGPDGVITKARPSCASLSDSGAGCSGAGGGGAMNIPITLLSCNAAGTHQGMWQEDSLGSTPAIACTASGFVEPAASVGRTAFSNTADASLYFQFILPSTYSGGAATLKIPSFPGAGSGDVLWQVGSFVLAVGSQFSGGSYNNATAIRSQSTAFKLAMTTVTLNTTGWVAGAQVMLKWSRIVACGGCTNGNMADAEYVASSTLLTVN